MKLAIVKISKNRRIRGDIPSGRGRFFITFTGPNENYLKILKIT